MTIINQVSVPVSSLPDKPLVPLNLYDYTLDKVLDDTIYIKNVWSKKESGVYGTVKVGMVPVIELMLDEIQDTYGKTNSSDFYSNMAAYGHSRIQHKYHLDHTAMRTMKSRKINGGKLEDVAGAFKTKKYLFEKTDGSRNQIPVYLDLNTVIAPSTQYRKTFNVNKSDLVQVYLSEAILQYPNMHPNNLNPFLRTLGEFDIRVKNFYDVVGGL